MAIITPTDLPKSARNRRVIEHFGGVFVLSLCLFHFPFEVGDMTSDLFLFLSMIRGKEIYLTYIHFFR